MQLSETIVSNAEIEAAIRDAMPSYEMRAAVAAALHTQNRWSFDQVMHVCRDMTEDGSPATVSDLDPKLVKRRRRLTRIPHHASDRRFCWLGMIAIDLLDGTPLRLLAELVALAGKAHSIITYTKSLATRLRVDRKTIQRAFNTLEAKGFVVATYDPLTQRRHVTIMPKTYPPRFQRTVSAQTWPIDPRDVKTQTKERIYKRQMEYFERMTKLEAFRGGATVKPHIKASLHLNP